MRRRERINKAGDWCGRTPLEDLSRAGDLLRLSMKVSFQLVNGIYATFKSDCLLNCCHEYSRAIMRFPTRFCSHFPEGFNAPSHQSPIKRITNSVESSFHIPRRERTVICTSVEVPPWSHKSLWTTSRVFVANKNEAYHHSAPHTSGMLLKFRDDNPSWELIKYANSTMNFPGSTSK